MVPMEFESTILWKLGFSLIGTNYWVLSIWSTDEPICRARIEKRMRRMDLWTLKEGEGGANGADSVDIYALPRVKWTASGKLLYSTGRSGRFSVVT